MKKITVSCGAALVVMGVIGAACSKVENQEIEAPKDNIVTLTTTVGFAEDAEDPATKALAIDYTAKTLKKTFAVGDQVMLTYDNEERELTRALSQPLTSEDISSDGRSAKLTFTLINPLENGEVLYAYPASMLDENGLIKEDSFYTQNGTLSDAAGRDYAEGWGSMTGTDLPASVTLENRLAIVAFTLKNHDTDITGTITGMTIGITGESIYDGSYTYDITGHDSDGHIYVAMHPFSSSTITITATDGTKKYTKTLTGKIYKENNFYQQGLKMAEYYTLEESEKGMIVGSDAKAYLASDKDNLSEGVTAVAMVAFKAPEAGGNLAIALSDESEAMPWASAISACDGKASPFAGSTWHLPTQLEWQDMLLIDEEEPSYSCSDLNTLLAAAGGDSLPAGSSYWTSTEDGTVYAYYVFLGNNGNASFGPGANKEVNSFRVRAVFAW